MKINQISADEIELKEGGAIGMVIGVAFLFGGIGVGVFLRESIPYGLYVATGMIGAGIALVLFASSITVNANKKSGEIRYQKKRLVGAQNLTFAVADVFRIETRKQWQMQNAPQQGNQQGPSVQQPVLVAQSVIVFKDGRELALDHQKNSATMGSGSAVLMSGQGAETAMAAQVAKFLNVPFAEIMPPNMGGGINIVSY
jgi:hypothetical protein